MHVVTAAEEPVDLESLTWPAFAAALQQLIGASCCAPALGTAGARAHPGILAKGGYAEWREKVKPARPLLPVRTGQLVFPDVDLPGEPGRWHVDVFVERGRIAHIVPAGSMPFEDANIIEEARRCILAPALVDMHGHMPPKNVLNLTPLFMLLNLKFGVVRSRDAGDLDGTSTPAALELFVSGALPGPRLHYSDAFVTSAPMRWSNSIAYDDPSQAPDVIRRLKRAGATWVKSYENLDVPRLRALVAAAADAGLGVMGHVPTRVTYEDALLPDAQHFFGVPLPSDVRRDHIVNRSVDWQAVDERRLETIVETAQQHGLALTPTLAAFAGFLRQSAHEKESASDDVRLLPKFYADIVWNPQLGLPVYRNASPADYDAARAALPKKKKLLAMLASAGVPLRLGTDAQQPFAVPGSALHREIDEFVEAGVSRATAWRWASTDAGKALGLEEFGVLEEGCPAEFLVASRSPYEAGWIPEAIVGVVTGSGFVTRLAIDERVLAELRRFEGGIAEHVTTWLARAALNRAAKNFVN